MTMADELRMGLQNSLRKSEMEHDAHYFLRKGVRALSLALMKWGFKNTWELLATNAPKRAPATVTVTGIEVKSEG